MVAKKHPKAKNGSPRATEQAASSRWLGRLGMYHTKRALTFHDAEELNRAIEALWNPSDELYRMPRSPAGALTMIVPQEAVPLFRARGFNFVEYPVVPARRGAHKASN
jgi:hypothetical protein